MCARVHAALGEEDERTKEARRLLVPGLLKLKHTQFFSQKPGLLLTIMTQAAA